jgi:hypothetical protein
LQLDETISLDAADFLALLAKSESHTQSHAHADRSTCAGCRQRLAAAAAHTRRQLELDPLHDSVQRRLLRLLAYQGQTAAAGSQVSSNAEYYWGYDP